MELTSTTTVNGPPQEVYDFWRGYDIFKNEADGCEKVVLKP